MTELKSKKQFKMCLWFEFLWPRLFMFSKSSQELLSLTLCPPPKAGLYFHSTNNGGNDVFIHLLVNILCIDKIHTAYL